MAILDNLIFDPHAIGAVQGEYNMHLVLLSWLVALAAAYTGLDIVKLTRQVRRVAWRWLWLWSGACVMGLGVWSMHFIGMHAYRLDFPLNHDPALTLMSMVPAILGSLGTMAVLSRSQVSHHALLWAGIGLGAGIGLMHYTGMAAMRMPAELYHATSLFLLSLLIAVGLGIVSVYAYRLFRLGWGAKRVKTCALISALGVSLAICGMHYVAMEAAWFAPRPNALISPQTMGTRSHWLSYLIGGGIAIIAILTLVAAQVSRRLRASAYHQYMTRTHLLEVLSALHDGVVLFDDKTRIRLCNAAFERLLGWSTQESIGRSVWHLSYTHDSEALNQQIQHALQTTGEWRGEIEARHQNGQRFPAQLSVSRVTYPDSDERDYVALLSDRSAEQRAQQRIRHLAYHDTLTGLPNRRALQERLADYDADHADGPPWALLTMLDIHRFKALNDSLGPDTGDELLRQLAERLQRWTKPGVDAARLDGNEFALLTKLSARDETAAQQEADHLIDEVIADLSADYALHGHTYPCRLNVGMLIFAPSEPATVGQWLKRVALALLEAKRQRDGHPRRFHPHFEQELDARVILERDLRYAIKKGELCLHVQPQVDADQCIIGAEALVRWEHPKRGRISPGHFIPVAEETGLIVPLGLWVLKEGCRLLGEWRQNPARRYLKLSLNVSVRQFQQPDFVDQVLTAIRQHDAPPERLTLELTESLMLSDPEGTIEKMAALRAIGVSFALDDFGTGYSSLTYLQSLPLDILKIDIAFVRDLGHERRTPPIAATIIALADSMGLTVVAEGVETPVQQAVLAELGCAIYQGYFFAAPLPLEAFHQLPNCLAVEQEGSNSPPFT
ncbi:EAL domain-containing protein [Halomonas sp. YLGW01]|uniref:EAL domain-containing protein n=1 Tax=Halomonas sp. YLGW01 TaxID=2773308 RepID=UPI00177FFF43|nr:EAL domain-containing protein [Halomonas sp. YLGW01]